MVTALFLGDRKPFSWPCLSVWNCFIQCGLNQIS